jgi:hypothetical protein
MSTPLERAVSGALRSAIDAHGPITKQNLGSAVKRVVSQIEAQRRDAARVERERAERGNG